MDPSILMRRSIPTSRRALLICSTTESFRTPLNFTTGETAENSTESDVDCFCVRAHQHQSISWFGLTGSGRSGPPCIGLSESGSR